MKTYLIKKSDIMLNGKVIPEGSTVKLDDKDAQVLSDYLVILDNPEAIPVKKQSNKKNNKRSKQ